MALWVEILQLLEYSIKIFLSLLIVKKRKLSHRKVKNLSLGYEDYTGIYIVYTSIKSQVLNWVSARPGAGVVSKY